MINTKQKSPNELVVPSNVCSASSEDIITADDYKDFWNEYEIVQETTRIPSIDDEDHIKQEFDDTENAAELLQVMGMGHFTEAFKQCREINDSELEASLRQLSNTQADTVKRRVRALNHTVRTKFGIPGRQPRGWQRKPDIRNVFRDVETSSTGTRSRSATPDSLDSIDKLGDHETDPPSPQALLTSEWPSSNWTENTSTAGNLLGSVPNFVKIFNQPDSSDGGVSSSFTTDGDKETLRRTPSAPPSCHRGGGGVSEENSSVSQYPAVLPPNDLFRRSTPWNNHRGDVASNSEGIELLGFSRIGTLAYPRNSRERLRGIRDSGSTGSMVNLVPSDVTNIHVHDVAPACFTSDDNNIVHIPVNSGPVSFEMLFSHNNRKEIVMQDVAGAIIDDRVSVDTVTDLDFKDLQPILWLELCTLFDKHSLKIQRRKPPKRKRKEDGNLFGVNLSTLVMRDYRLINDTSVIPVPLIIRDLLSRLSGPRLRDEGILRIAGNKQKVENICNELENHFYSKPIHIKALLDTTNSHELVSVFKRILRDLPQPLFTVELIHLFYECHAIKNENDQLHALNFLVLLLPVENRSTLYSLLQFLMDVVHNEEFNKMNLHNVAMIIAPSLFPPRYVRPPRAARTDLAAQVLMAATCCHLMEQLIKSVAMLQTIPSELLKQSRRCSQDASGCRRNKDQKQAKLIFGKKGRSKP